MLTQASGCPIWAILPLWTIKPGFSTRPSGRRTKPPGQLRSSRARKWNPRVCWFDADKTSNMFQSLTQCSYFYHLSPISFIISFTPLLQQLSSLGLTRLTWVVWFGFLYSYKWSQINQVSKLGWNGFRIPWAKVYWVSQSVTSSFLERLLIPNTVDI